MANCAASQHPVFIVSAGEIDWRLPLPYATGKQLYPDVDHVLSREAGVYLRFIVDNYNCLPPIIGFIHGHSESWHSPDTNLALKQAINAARGFERSNCTDYFISLYPQNARLRSDRPQSKAESRVSEVQVNRKLLHFFDQWFPEGRGPQNVLKETGGQARSSHPCCSSLLATLPAWRPGSSSCTAMPSTAGLGQYTNV